MFTPEQIKEMRHRAEHTTSQITSSEDAVALAHDVVSLLDWYEYHRTVNTTFQEARDFIRKHFPSTTLLPCMEGYAVCPSRSDVRKFFPNAKSDDIGRGSSRETAYINAYNNVKEVVNKSLEQKNDEIKCQICKDTGQYVTDATTGPYRCTSCNYWEGKE